MNRILPFFVLALALGVLSGCDFLKREDASLADPTKKEPLAVRVVEPVSRTIVDYAELNGRTAAVESVEIRPQVSGYLEKIHFQPGSRVRKGDVLFSLDARVYEAILAQRKADVSAKAAELKQLEADLARQKSLIDKNATSRQEFDLALAERDRCAAELEAAQANRDRAQIDVDYATVRSPIDGEVGREQITVGNLATAGTTILTRVVAVEPLYVFFDVDERTLLRFRRESLGQISKEEFFVEFGVGDSDFSRKARVDFSEPKLNETTGTLEFRAVADNAPNENGTRNLLPGLRLRVRFPISPSYEALLIPEDAISTDQNVKRVFVVDATGTVRVAKIELGALQDDNMRVVKSGLTPDSRVVVDNLLRVREGEPVAPTLVASESNARVVREDGTFLLRDGTSFNDGLYESFQDDEETAETSKTSETNVESASESSAELGETPNRG